MPRVAYSMATFCVVFMIGAFSWFPWLHGARVTGTGATTGFLAAGRRSLPRHVWPKTRATTRGVHGFDRTAPDATVEASVGRP
jgi:hypothetical protein